MMPSGKLTVEERLNFEVTLAQKPSCYAHELAKIILEGKQTLEDLLQTEILLRKGCAAFYMLGRIYEDFCIKKFHEKLEREVDHNSKKRGKK